VVELLLVILRFLLGHEDSEFGKFRTMVARADGRTDSGPSIGRWSFWPAGVESWLKQHLRVTSSVGDRRPASTHLRSARGNRANRVDASQFAVRDP